MLNIYFGLVGCGKTSFAAKIAYLNSRSKYPLTLYHNIPELSFGTYIGDDLMHLGQYTLDLNSMLIIDEAGIDYNSRKTLSLPQYQIKWYKLFRHYKCREIHFFSQDFEDMDITIRRLAARLFYIRRLGKLPFSLIHSVEKYFKPSDEGDLKWRYRLANPFRKFIPFFGDPLALRALSLLRYRKYFDSYAAPELPSYEEWKSDLCSSELRTSGPPDLRSERSSSSSPSSLSAFGKSK